jgi:4-hydroxybenzoyl-CoA thioesterase
VPHDAVPADHIPVIFTHRVVVRFGQVDAAGIVYYPRYFEMLNDVVEAWFADALDEPFPRLVAQGTGVPLVSCSVQFVAASRLGDELEMRLSATRLGRSSFDLRVECWGAGQNRFRAELRHAMVSLNPLVSVPLPDPLRARINAYLVP